MSHFPVILIPSSIQQIKSARPPIPTFTEPLPQQPGAEPQKVNTTIIAVEAVGVTVPSAAIVSQGGTVPGLLLFLAVGGAIAAQVWQQIKTYPQRKLNHQRETGTYSRKLENYEQKKRHHEHESRLSQSPERVAEFQYRLLQEVLRRTNSHDGDRSVARRGWSEAKFGECLKRYFPGKIHSGLTLNIPNFDHPYTADFTYVDSSLNLYIDIEIDEPYVYSSGNPTHFLEAEKDSKRNNFFINKGWLVIRFSEEQVVCYPQSCCKTIASAIAEVLGDTSVLNQFANVPNLQEMSRWTQSEAEVMAAEGYRERYLT